MIDTHAHINSKVLKDLKNEIITINKLDYLDKVINVGTDEDTNLEVLAIANNFDKFYCSLGVHPLMEGSVESILKIIEFNNNASRVVAIGETGIDSSAEIKPQVRKFIETIEIANFLKLPIIIHANNTNKLILDILKKHPARYGFVFHCFQPEMPVLEEIIRRDGYISVGKPITSANAKKSLEIVKNIPLNNLLIETDYPYMADDKIIDGKYIFKKVQELRGIEHKELERALDANAKRLFRKLE